MGVTMTIFEQNLEVLSRNHAELMNIVKHPIESGHVKVEQSKKGSLRLRVTTSEGHPVDLHDEEEPIQVAQGTVAQMEIPKQGVIVSLGLELGYFAKAISPKLNRQVRLLLYEADPAIFLMALKTVDLTEVLESPWIKILVGPNVSLRQVATYLVSQTNGTLRIVSYEPVFRLAPDVYGRWVEQELDRIPGIVKATKNAIVRRGPMFIDSVLRNVPHIMGAGAATSLTGIGKGRPGLLVSAGPSLRKNVHHIKSAKGRAMIIAADTALGYLLSRDIIPDVVVSVDPQKDTYKKFKNLEIPSEIALVYHPSVSPHIVKHFPGPTYSMDASMPVYEWLKPFLLEKGTLDVEAMCQAHVAFNVAEWMGCAPIVFVGQDLCFSDDRLHVRQGGYMTEAEQAAFVAEGIVTKDIFGHPVKTNPTFANYKAVFERKIRRFSGQVFQATEGGLGLEGAENRLLADIVQEYCQGPTIDFENRLSSRPAKPNSKDIDRVYHEVRARARDLFRLERTSRHIHRLLQTMKQRWDANRQVDPEFTRLGKQVERLTHYIPRYVQVRELLHWMKLELEIQLSQDTQTLEEERDLQKKHEIQLNRGLRYYGGLIQIAPGLREKCESLCRRLEQWRGLVGTRPGQDQGHTWLEWAEGYASIELFSQAEECLSRHFEGKSDHSLSIGEAALSIRIPLSQHQWTQALAHAEAARDAHPDNPEIKTLWNQAKLAFKQWQECKMAAQDQGLPPLESHVQAGDFYHRTGNFARAKAHYRLALEEEGRVPDEAWDFFDDMDLGNGPSQADRSIFQKT